MNINLKYVPILRGRQEEIKVLKTFNFGKRIYPCLEIIRELDRKPSKASTSSKKVKKFEDVYIPLIDEIKAEKVFIDLPIHFNDSIKSIKVETLEFMRSVVTKRDVRTRYLISLSALSEKIIPIISTYFDRTNEKNSITQQEKDLRAHFKEIGFRTFLKSFSRDIIQIEKVVSSADYIIIDLEDYKIDLTDPDILDIIDKISEFDCSIIIHRNSFPKKITNVGLAHGQAIESIDNTLLESYSDFNCNSFSDYCGIKKDDVTDGGTISPGFVYYDSTINKFFGYKGKIKELSEFETTIVPDVISSEASKRMKKHKLPYLNSDNIGWRIISNIDMGLESGKSPAKFKRISLEHYLHCLKLRIENGDFD